MSVYIVKNVPPESYFSLPVYLDEGFFLAAPETPFSAELARALEDWEFAEILSDGEVRDSYAGEYEDGEDEAETGPASALNMDPVRRAEEFYRDLQDYAERIFMRGAIGMDLELGELTERVKAICAMIRENRRLLLRTQYTYEPDRDRDFLAVHTVKSTVTALILGSYLKLPPHRLIELGISALVHEIGMVKIPRQIYTARRSLSPEERTRILSHPVSGYNILRANNFPLAICTAALQHHERENGSGYPQMLSGEQINPYAKIIAVTCSFEALTADRPHKNAKDGHTGMMDLLKNEGKLYHDGVIRALVYSLSIYPVGMYVLLSSGQQAQVVDVNPENPRFPVVRLPGEAGPDGKSKTLETSAGGTRIVRPLSREETAAHGGGGA